MWIELENGKLINLHYVVMVSKTNDGTPSIKYLYSDISFYIESFKNEDTRNARFDQIKALVKPI